MTELHEDEIYESLRRKIKNLSIYAWGRRIGGSDIDDWLGNFISSDEPASCEQLQMLHLLGQFMYFGSREMRELTRAVYRDKFKYRLVEEIRRTNADTLDASIIKSEYAKVLEKTRFLGIGNPSESGTHLLYYFRQENELPKSLFINGHEITKREGAQIMLRDRDIQHYVFIDDLCGSGDQAESYSKDIVSSIKEMNPDATVAYYCLFAMSEGIAHVRDHTLFDEVDCVYELDDSFKCFGERSRHYKGDDLPIDKSYGRQISEKYGRMLFPSDPLGYGDCQLLLGMHHNTPDNTLPIIWFDENYGPTWVPAFKRYNKNYG